MVSLAHYGRQHFGSFEPCPNISPMNMCAHCQKDSEDGAKFDK